MGISFPLSDVIKRAFVCLYWEGIDDEQCEAFASRWGGLDLAHFRLAFEDGTGDEKVLAIFALGLTASAEVTHLLVPLLFQAPRRERWASALCLGLMKDPRSFPALESLLLDGLDLEEYIHALQKKEKDHLHELTWCGACRWHAIQLLEYGNSPSLVPVMKQTFVALWNIQRTLRLPLWIEVSNYDALAYALGQRDDFTLLDLADLADLPREFRHVAMVYLAAGYLQARSPGVGALTGLPSQIAGLQHEIMENKTLQQAIAAELAVHFGLSAREQREILTNFYEDESSRGWYGYHPEETEGEEEEEEEIEEEKPQIGTSVLVCLYQEHTARIQSLAWSPDGTHIVSGGEDATARVWESVTGRTITVFRGHTASVNLVAWSPQSHLIASGGSDHIVYLWDARTGEQVNVYQGHHSWLWGGLAWSPDGTRLASASLDHTVHVWDALSGTPLVIYRGHGGLIASLAWSPDGTHLVSGEGYPECTIHVWDAQTGERLLTYHDHERDVFKQRPLEHILGDHPDADDERWWRGASSVHGLAWSPDGKWIVSAGLRNVYRVWDAHSGENRVISDHSQGPLVWLPNREYLASPIPMAQVDIWQVLPNKPIVSYPIQGMYELKALSFSPDGNVFTVSGRDSAFPEQAIAQVWKILS